METRDDEVALELEAVETNMHDTEEVEHVGDPLPNESDDQATVEEPIQVGELADSDNAGHGLSIEHSLETLKPVVEAVLFTANKSVSIKAIQRLFGEVFVPSIDLIKAVLSELQQDYRGRGVELVEVASGFRFQVPETLAPWVRQTQAEKPQKYSRALLETLALIAYRQPITRGEIEDIRGVSVSSHIIKTLQERHWIRVVGHKELPGRPALLATTPDFLDYFNLSSLQDLPALTEGKSVEEQEAALLNIGANVEQGASAEKFDEPNQSNQLHPGDIESFAAETEDGEPLSFQGLSEKFEPED